jgi:hypothetical protein
MPRKSISFQVKGPVVQGKTAPIVADMLRQIDKRIAVRYLDTWRKFLKARMRHPSGKYERHMVVRERRQSFLVTDSNMVYGPWLEGIGRRNRTTRFKGYAAQRRAKQAVDRDAVVIAHQVVHDYSTHQLGGR